MALFFNGQYDTMLYKPIFWYRGVKALPGPGQQLCTCTLLGGFYGPETRPQAISSKQISCSFKRTAVRAKNMKMGINNTHNYI